MIGHLLRIDNLPKIVIEGDVESILDMENQWWSMWRKLQLTSREESYKEFKKLSNDRDVWRTIANQSNDWKRKGYKFIVIILLFFKG